MLEIWARNCRRNDRTPSSSSLVCSEHFEAKWITMTHHGELWTDQKRATLLPHAVPTIFNIPPYLVVSWSFFCHQDKFQSMPFQSWHIAIPLRDNLNVISQFCLITEYDDNWPWLFFSLGSEGIEDMFFNLIYKWSFFEREVKERKTAGAARADSSCATPAVAPAAEQCCCRSYFS